MKSRTYYDILGVSQEATLQEITSAKNALAKVYHPDANVHQDIDTTAFMQEILEAYQVLSNPEKRQAYDRELGGDSKRVFRTFTVGDSEDETSSSFVIYWNAACKLQEIVTLGADLMQDYSASKHKNFFFFFKRKKESLSKQEKQNHLNELSLRAIQYITILKAADIPSKYWSLDAMNWVLVRWGQRQNMDYHMLFHRYDVYLEQELSSSERHRIHAKNKQFHNHLKKLLSCTL